jgi:hypothetical protein
MPSLNETDTDISICRKSGKALPFSYLAAFSDRVRDDGVAGLVWQRRLEPAGRLAPLTR